MKPAAFKRVEKPQGSIGTRTSPRWSSRRRVLDSVSVPTKMPYGAVECGIGEGRHRGRIFAEDRDVLTGRSQRQVIGERPIAFDAGQIVNTRAKEIGRDAGPRTELENVRAELDALEDPRQDTDVDGRFPIGATAQPAMDPVHDAFVSSAPRSAAMLCCRTRAIREALCLAWFAVNPAKRSSTVW